MSESGESSEPAIIDTNSLGDRSKDIDLDSIRDSAIEPLNEDDEIRRRHELARKVSSSAASEPHGVLARLESLSRSLSRLTTRDRKLLIDPNDFDLRQILTAIVHRSYDQGIHIKKSGVTFMDVSAYGVDESASFAATVGDILKGPVTIYRNIRASRAPEREIIKKITGLARPGEMVLVLGRPGAGCSTLLKTIAGEIEEFTNTEGEILYDGIPQKEMMQKFKADVIYNPELDVHFPHLTVDQTLRFAIACKTPETRVNSISREEYITAMRDILATVFGLRHTYHTKVGNDFVRGISGGERKRVSIAEALAARGSIYCWDNATRGLDASTALEYAQAIRAATNLLQATAFVTIYQAGEGIYETFDKVTILYLGRQIYFGAATEAKKYFEDMGFECPQRQATAEFLTAITDPQGRFPRQGYETRVPRNAEEFEQRWLESPEYASLLAEISEYKSKVAKEETVRLYHAGMKQEKMKHQRIKSRYTVTLSTQLRLLTRRSMQRIWGDKAYTITQIIAALVQSLVTGSMYYNIPTGVDGAFSRSGTIFFAVLYYSLMGIAEIADSFNNRPILRKQKGYSFYHPAAEALASTVCDIPIKFIIITIFALILYFLSGLAREAGKFFIFYLFLFLCAITMTAFFKALASFNKTIAAANGVGGLFLLALLVYSSYMIQRPSMHPWFKWISYINPVTYAYEGMVMTEFHGREMECGRYIVPAGVDPANQVCSFKGADIGQNIVSGDRYMKVAFGYSYGHVWRNLGILIAFMLAFITLLALGTEFVSPMVTGGDKLMFKRGKLPDHIILPHQKKTDSESKETSVTPEQLIPNKEKKANMFTDLVSKDLFAWKNVTYVIPYDGTERTLLENVSGYCKPGTLTALMGESGAGKTTLLNTLAQRTTMGVVTGDMLVNGRPLDKSFSRRTGYVQQQDLHISELTVRESLIFAARMRRANDVPDSEKLEYVEKIIEVLNMKDYSDAIVGAPGFGLNVEQRKKLSIGVELVAKPSLLLFLDEPTSGLDSQSAWAIVQLLRDLANAGQSILCTIHQPSATLFEEFDRLLLLRKGGETVYFGDIGKHSRTLLDYFESKGARHCESSENPAEYILESIGAGATAAVTANWYQKWIESEEYRASNEEVDHLISSSLSKSVDETDKSLHHKFAAPYLTQLKYVILRTSTQFWRSPEYFASRYMLSILAGLFLGFTFWDLKHSITGLQNGLFVGFLSCVISAPLINMIQERAIASRELFEVRESLSNTFHWSALLIAQYVNEVPYMIGAGSLFYCCIYFPTKAPTNSHQAGVYYLTYCLMFQLYYGSFGLFIVYVSPDLASANVLVSLCFAFIISFCGVVQPYSLMPVFWKFMYRVSPYTYFIQNLVGSVLKDREVVCAKDEISYFIPVTGQTCEQFAGSFVASSGGALIDPSNSTLCGYCTYSNANEYMATIGIHYSYVWRNFGFFWIYIIFNVIAMLGLYYIFRVRRGISISDLIDKFKNSRKKN